MRFDPADRVRELTAVLSVVSLALVFAAALQAIPTAMLPSPDWLLSAIPHVNAVLSLAAIGTILSGLRAIKGGDVGRHRQFMLASVALFAGFLLLYLYRVAIKGPTSFEGPAWVASYVYAPFLALHILLAMICIPLLYYVLLLAATRPVSALPDTPHPRVGRIAALLWLVSFVMGVAVYLSLYWIW